MAILSQDRLAGNLPSGGNVWPDDLRPMRRTSEPLLCPGPAEHTLRRKGGKGQSPEALDGPKGDESTSLDTGSRSSIFNSRQATKARLVSLLREIGQPDLADSIQICHAEYRTLACANGHHYDAVPTHKCRFRLCPDCARARASAAFKRVYPKLVKFKRENKGYRPVFITLTIKSSFDTLCTVDRFVKRFFRRLRQSKAWQERIKGAVAGFEITFSPAAGWHYHVHILAFRNRSGYWPQAELAAQWARITDGMGTVVDIRAVQDFKGSVKEVLKYCCKLGDISNWGDEQVEQFLCMGRKKLADCYGELRGLIVDDDDYLEAFGIDNDEVSQEIYAGAPCPQCGLPLEFQILSAEEFHQICRKNDTS